MTNEELVKRIEEFEARLKKIEEFINNWELDIDGLPDLSSRLEKMEELVYIICDRFDQKGEPI